MGDPLRQLPGIDEQAVQRRNQCGSGPLPGSVRTIARSGILEARRQVPGFRRADGRRQCGTAVHRLAAQPVRVKQVVGDRWCLLPHASDFIDPLFSSGLAVTVMILNALGHRLIDAVRNNCFSTERFSYVQEWTKLSFDYYDKLVSASYTSFDSFELWNAWFRV